MTIQTIFEIETITPPSMGLIDHVGNTPLLPLNHLPGAAGISPAVQIFAKAEWFNPGGSVKARPARNIMQTAIEQGDLIPAPLGNGGKRLLDATSGNMGIAYATLGASLRIPISLAVPANASPERLTILQALGAQLTLTDPAEGTDGAILVAQSMAAQQPNTYHYTDQYNNPANWQAHYKTTGPEIAQQTLGQITHFVAGLGTSGTLTGTGRYLREHIPGVTLISFQPNSPFHGLEGLKHMDTAITPGIYDPTLADENIAIETEAAYEMVNRLAREEGYFVGISSGAAAVAALQVASTLERGVVVTVFPDAGDKYLSAGERLWKN